MNLYPSISLRLPHIGKLAAFFDKSARDLMKAMPNKISAVDAYHETSPNLIVPERPLELEDAEDACLQLWEKHFEDR